MNDIKHIYLWCLEDEPDSFGNFADISSRTISMYFVCDRKPELKTSLSSFNANQQMLAC